MDKVLVDRELLERITTPLEGELSTLERENVELTAERNRLQRNLNFTEQWYAVRFERLADLGKSAGCWDAMAAIIANGTADQYETPTYAQQLVRANHRADVAERERDQLQAEVEALREAELLLLSVCNDLMRHENADVRMITCIELNNWLTKRAAMDARDGVSG